MSDARNPVNAGDDLPELEHLFARGQMLATQMPRNTEWSPCKKLAASVLASALVEIRDHADAPSYAKRVREDLDWIAEDDHEWPFSFVRICQLLDLEVDWVRARVDRWMATPPDKRRRSSTPYRQAA